MTILSSERLMLEPITSAHYEDMRRINAEPAVMRFLNDGIAESEAETRAMIARVTARWKEWGYSWWALRRKDEGRMIGMACLQHLGGDAGAPREIGWRLAEEAWGQGYASEAARTIVDFAFGPIGADLVYAVAHPGNAASIAVMTRLGMEYGGVETHYGRPCVVYRLRS